MRSALATLLVALSALTGCTLGTIESPAAAQISEEGSPLSPPTGSAGPHRASTGIDEGDGVAPSAPAGEAAPSTDPAPSGSTDDAPPPPPPSSEPGTPAATDSDSSKSPLGKYVVTWYTFQGNTPVNSALSGSGRQMVPYLSIAVPFRLLKAFGGKLAYGDKLFVEFLAGRTMPNGIKHTGWVQVDDFCGDSGDDSYCFQSVGGVKYPNVDLYIGDFTKSGMSTTTCSGPAGSGQELTNVSTGTPGGGEWIANYGGSALGSGKCGDVVTAKSQHGGCWYYTPPATSASYCSHCTETSCASW
jgi:hypothetical protein